MLRNKLVRMLAVILLVLAVGCSSKDGSSAAPVDSGSPAGETSTQAPPVIGGSSASEYAAAVCTALADWTDALQSQSQDFASIGTDPAAAVDALGSFVDQTDELIDTLNALGAPDVEGGEEAHTLLVGALTSLRDSYQGLSDAFANIDPNDPAAISQALAEFEATFTNSDLQSQFEALQNTEIAQAFQSETACTQAGFGGAS